MTFPMELAALDFQAEGTDIRFVESLRNTGFGVLENHPLDLDLIASIYEHWHDFFKSDRPSSYVLKRDTQDGFFSRDDSESAKGFDEQDIKEYFHFYTWGQCPEDLRDELMSYYRAAHDFAATLLSWIEQQSLPELADGYSEPLSDMIVGSDMTLLRILHYPPLTGNESAVRAAPHEDINLLTILPVASAPGLQVLGTDGNWNEVPCDINQVVVNTGDMLQEASQGYFPSTTHRVINPQGEDMQESRMSLPIFLHPRPEVVLSERYTADSYLNERLRELGVV